MGLREKTESICEITPKPGTIAMYTSGCPKNQNRCCHSNGDPPEWFWSCPLTSKPEGRKKLVPALRSRISSTQAAKRTAKLSKLRIAVISQAQQVSGMRMSVMPLHRRSTVVTIKFKAPSKEPTQKSAMETAQRFCPIPSPGPALLPTALSGGYAVQPEIGGPSLTNRVATREHKAKNVTQNE